MNIRRVEANRKVKDDESLTALEYGPVVYCAEGIDNGGQLSVASITDNTVLTMQYRRDVLNGVNVIVGAHPAKDGRTAKQFIAIPYYLWSNRGIDVMKVWLARN